MFKHDLVGHTFDVTLQNLTGNDSWSCNFILDVKKHYIW